jgi:hypothetical protein
VVPSPPDLDPAAALVLLRLKTARRGGHRRHAKLWFSPAVFYVSMRQAVAAIARFTAGRTRQAGTQATNCC